MDLLFQYIGQGLLAALSLLLGLFILLGPFIIFKFVLLGIGGFIDWIINRVTRFRKALGPHQENNDTPQQTDQPCRASDDYPIEGVTVADLIIREAELKRAQVEISRLQAQATSQVSPQELASLREHLSWMETQHEQFKADKAQLLSQVRDLNQALATTQDIPEGKLLTRGRLIVAKQHLAIIPSNGRPFKVLKCYQWEYAGETGDEVLLEALMQHDGWTAWRVVIEKPNQWLEPLDQGLVDRLTAVRDKNAKPDFNQLDLEAAQNQVRVASHSKTAISLHIVLPTHCRFSLTEDQAEDLKAIVVELVKELDLGKV